MANALTAIRLLLVFPFAITMAAPDATHAFWTAFILLTAIASDVLDGVIARRRGTASAGGRLFDHATDALFVTSGLAAGALRGAIPWILPVLVGAAFVQYVIDSYVLDRGGRLRPSALGRWNGILYFVPLVGDVVARLGWSSLRPVVVALAWVLVASTLVSIGQRFHATLTTRRRRAGSPAEGRGDRSRR